MWKQRRERGRKNWALRHVFLGGDHCPEGAKGPKGHMGMVLSTARALCVCRMHGRKDVHSQRPVANGRTAEADQVARAHHVPGWRRW